MGLIPLGERPAPSQPPKGFVPFALGFRPFFSLAALSGLILMLLWLGLWQTATPVQYYGNIGWHSHEMLFGFVSAIIAGFLLTAVRNWTGIDTLTHTPLAMLALLWLLARIAPFVPSMPASVIALLDLSFLPLLALALYRPLIEAENRINRIFLPLLAAMSLANLLVHLESLGLTQTGRQGINLMISLVALLMVMVSGRVMPFFTEKAVNGSMPHFSTRRERLGFISIGLWITFELFLPIPWLMALAALGIVASQVWRLWDWHHPHVWRIPILWVLYTGLIWLIIGYLLKSLAVLGLFPDNLATHALTSGAIGILTFGMMARVSLGHTGREITPPRLIALSFVLLNLAVLARVFGPVIYSEGYSYWIMLSGTGWAFCYLLFVVFYIKLLNTPRIDGRRG
ncbi:MAG: NnrS family protein [Candidatus Thiodiazotropha sp. (ex Monitilora ramsayi)]|nr:NnrS family protein [Candidatus Thiodiazotropha sp. (ex Monitilora ramsayi)]